MITVGIDIGSNTTKGVLLDSGRIRSEAIMPTGHRAGTSAERVFRSLLEAADGLKPAGVAMTVATGYGRNAIDFADRTVTEISCHARGARFLNTAVRSVIDIGGQDSKVLVMDANGSIRDFAMNDKCAAGTGRFLEVMARALDVDLDTMGPLSLSAPQPSSISSLCTVFAESEVISLVADGEERKNILAGIHASIAARVTAMAMRVGIVAPLMMTGGVARNIGVVRAIEQKTAMAVEVSPQAQITGAIGAALLAAEG